MVEIIKQSNGIWWIEHPIRKGRFSSLHTRDEVVAKIQQARAEAMLRAWEKKREQRPKTGSDDA
jgi:hypothetical protein